jgi:hypothetical protein
MGEHQGEDASSPTTVTFAPQTTTIAAPAGQDAFDPLTTPAQAIVESEPYEWWTVGRRVRIGRAVAAAADSHGAALPASATLSGLVAPYDRLNGTGPDGRILWQQRTTLGLDVTLFGSPGPPATEPVDGLGPNRAGLLGAISGGGEHADDHPARRRRPRLVPRRRDDPDDGLPTADLGGVGSRRARFDGDRNDRSRAHGGGDHPRLAALPWCAAAAVVGDQGQRGVDRRAGPRPFIAGDAAADRPDRQPL